MMIKLSGLARGWNIKGQGHVMRVYVLDKTLGDGNKIPKWKL